MPYWDLRSFIQKIDEMGELRRVKVEVSAQLEIAAITDQLCKQESSPALWFEQVRGFSSPVITNLFGSLNRVAIALQTESPEDLRVRLSKDLQSVSSGSTIGSFSSILDEKPWQPWIMDQAPCQEITKKIKPNLLGIPALKSWPKDGGNYFTLPVVFTQSPFSEETNCGMYRVQVFDENTFGIRWGEASDGGEHFRQWQQREKPMPVAIAIGGDPALIFSAGFPLPRGLSETAFAGYLQQQPISVTKCVSNDLYVPAHAEFIIEGLIDPSNTITEGPFGNHTGYYVEKTVVPLGRVTAITHRRDAVCPATIVGRAPMEDCYLAKATERLLLAILQTEYPCIDNLNFPMEGIFHGCALLSLKEGAAGIGAELIRSLWEKSLLKNSRLLIVYNHGVDITDGSEAYWHAVNGTFPARDVFIDGFKMGIDVTQSDRRVAVESDMQIQRLISRRWHEYGLD